MRCSSVGWPARLNSSIDCSVGVTESLAACSSSSGGDALIDAAGIDRDRAAETRSDEADARGIDGGVLGEEGERVARVLDLLQADHAAEFALAVAAAAHVETQHHVAELVEHLGGLHGVR